MAKIPIRVSQANNRYVTMQKRFNDSSGHTHIIDMLESVRDQGWSIADTTEMAFECMYEVWSEGRLPLKPLHPKAQTVTQDMRQASQQLLNVVAHLKQIVQSGGFINNGDYNQMMTNLESVQNTIEFDTVQGSSVYASDIIEIEEYDEDWDDE